MMWWVPTASANTFMPPAASEIAKNVDSLYEFLLVASLISFVILVGGMIYFVFRYKRQSDNDKTAYITHDSRLEFLWSFIPFVIFMVSFVWGAVVYYDMRTVPEDEDALEIMVYGKKWAWEFVYRDGRKIIGDVDDQGKPVPPTIVVPENKAVKLIMTSVKVNPDDKRDRAVLHSFYVPAMRVKQDIVPGRYTKLWFNANKKGLFNVFCTEYCGTGHSAMLARIKVVSALEFDNWVLGESSSGPKVESLADIGKRIYSAKACAGCHSLDGSKMTGPTWKGLWGRKNRGIADGDPISVVDENYIRESIMNPSAKYAEGFKGKVMPAYQGQLDEKEIDAIIEFMKKFK